MTPEPLEPGPHAGKHFEIDRRPLLVVLASRLKRQLGLIAAFALFALVLDLEPPEGLTSEGWATLCVFGLCATLWATNLLPTAVTSLLAIALVPMLGILPARVTYAYFGSKVVFFILGAFMLAAAMIATGLSARLATAIVSRFGATPRRLVFSVFFLCAGASTLMSEHAVAVMIFPVVSDIAKALGLKRPDSPMGRALFYALAWGCIIGGSLTVLGGGRGPLAIGILEEVTGERHTIGFVEYMAYSWPLVVMLGVVAATTLWRAFPPEVTTTDKAREVLRLHLREMGKMHPREAAVGLVLIITVALWATAGDTVGLANIAIVSMAALFALGALGWKDIQRHVNWGIVVMYGGAICLGAVMERSGAALWMTERLMEGADLDVRTLMLVLALVGALLTEFMSNSAVVAMLMPPALSMAEASGVHPAAMTMAVVLPSNFAFMFPISTPVTALCWSSGFWTPRSIARRGLPMHAFAWASMGLLIYVFWPAMGLIQGP